MTLSQSCVRLAITAIRDGRKTLNYRIAIFHIRAAIRYANRNGESRASLFRILNWLRADLRRIG